MVFRAYLLITIICCIEVRFTVLQGQWIMWVADGLKWTSCG